MRKNHTKRVVIGAAALSLLFAGSAFTASNSMPDNHTLGFGSTQVSGADVEAMSYTTNVRGEQVTELSFTFDQADNGQHAHLNYSATVDGEPVEETWSSKEIVEGNATFTVAWDTEDIHEILLVVTDEDSFDGSVNVDNT